MIQAQQTRMDTKKWDSLQWKIYMLNMLAILWYRSRGSSWRHFLERNKHEFYCYRFSFFTHNLYSHFMECIFFQQAPPPILLRLEIFYRLLSSMCLYFSKKIIPFLRKKINQIRPICVFVVLYSIETVCLRTHTYLFSLLGASYICKMSYCTKICEPPTSSYNQ